MRHHAVERACFAVVADEERQIERCIDAGHMVHRLGLAGEEADALIQQLW